MTEPTTPQQQADVDALRAQRYETTRATVPALEELLHTPVPLLDHGFVRVTEWDKNVPRGAVVCTAVLDHTALVTGPEHDGQVTVAGTRWVRTGEWGDFGLDRWLWFLRDVEPVDPPAPARGRQGFWNWERCRENR